jgi:endonuclease YncB( thermonuclease family)
VPSKITRRFTRLWLALAVLALVIVAVASFASSSFSAHPSGGDVVLLPRVDGFEIAQVERVVDGDTIVVTRRGSSDHETVRLVGVDAPETVDRDRPVGCFGPEASEFLTELLADGTAVYLEADPVQGDTDRYGRLLRYVYEFSADGPGESVNLQLLRDGYAEAYRGDHQRQSEYGEATRDAEESGAGLWSACPA